MPTFAEFENSPDFQTQAALIQGGRVDFGDGTTANYFGTPGAARTTGQGGLPNGGVYPGNPDAASNGGINPGGTSAGSVLAGSTPGGSGMSGFVRGVLNSAPQAAQLANGAQPGQYANMLQGFDPAKLAAGKNDPKYNFAAIAQDYAPTPAGYQQLVQDPRFQSAGFSPVGKDSIRLPDGSVVDVGLSFGSGGGKGWWWGASDPNAPAGGAMAAPGAPAGGGNPFAGYAPSGGGAPNLSNIPGYTPFVAPDPSQVQNDPAYQFDVQQGLNALQHSAAAKGGLLSGNTLRAISDYGQGQASNEYQNIFNRALQTNQTNNQNALGFGNLGLGYGNLGLGYYNATNNYTLGLGNLALGNTQAQNAFTLGLGNLGLGYANYGLNAQGQQFNQQYGVPLQYGYSAAQGLGNYGSQYGANASNTITGLGNAQGAANIARGNAYGNALGGIGNAAIGYGMYQGMNPYGSGYGYGTPYYGQSSAPSGYMGGA